MKEQAVAAQIERVPVEELLPQLRATSVFSGIEECGLLSVGALELMHLERGDRVEQQGDERNFLVVLKGLVKLRVPEKDDVYLLFHAGESLGEIPILANKSLLCVVTALEPTMLVRFTEQQFWKLMFACPSVRSEILGTMARRLEAYQIQEIRREKLSSLGALAAGLMHELKNPSSAAIRAASQMRENMVRLQHLTLKLSGTRHTDDQTECLAELQRRALAAVCCKAMSSIEQSDAEEALERQLEDAGVENSWRVAGTLISMGMTAEEFQCASAAFSGSELSDSLNWLESLMSSVQLVGTIEESLGRVKDLIMAVKHYSYGDESAGQPVNIHDSIQSTLLILGHKLRQKSVTMERDFDKNLPLIRLHAGGLNQVWTNLFDNAIDAAPEHSSVRVRTWQQDAAIHVSIEDHGSGIAPADAPHIFEPFFTTKPVGEGTGLGLDIVHRIVSMKLGGVIEFESRPGHTVFTVTLPLAPSAQEALPVAAARS